MNNEHIFSPLGASNHSKKERVENDFYATDYRAATHIFNKVPELYNMNNIIEPCAGDGTMGDVIKKITNKNIDMYDLVPKREDIIERNYFNLKIKDKYDLIITNPPFRKGNKKNPGLTDIILKMLDDVKSNGYVCLFLKTLALESQERYNRIYSTMPPEKIFVYAPRISCYRDNDLSLPQGAISYSWFVWHKNNEGTYDNNPPQLGWIEKL